MSTSSWIACRSRHAKPSSPLPSPRCWCVSLRVAVAVCVCTAMAHPYRVLPGVVHTHRSEVDHPPRQARPQGRRASAYGDDGTWLAQKSTRGLLTHSRLTPSCCCVNARLQALHPAAHHAYSQTADIAKIVAHYADRVHEGIGAGVMKRQSSMGAALMTPVKPMLAKACKSFEVCVCVHLVLCAASACNVLL